jgi:NhaP-type Na+/H+ or K+/H+ antiporter
LRAPSVEDAVADAVETRVADLRQRLRLVENRLPAEATLEKSASVNDAILATRLEAVQEAITNLQQQKQLTKWDVAVVVFAILTALGVIAGIVTGILAVVGHHS